ncbi:hypothetical protein KR018_007544 [Drosophila ironensis]|nr:hypothetical protein KR018_007544 [Drosophila ironensis]
MSDSSLAVLNTLSNKQLLAKCLELGLPGVPVTDSTRSVIIRRLQAAISGAPPNKGKATPKSRRETVHGGQVVSPALQDKRSSTSRRTIAHGSSNTAISGRPLRETTTTVSDVGSQSEDDDFFVVDAPCYSQRSQRPAEENRPRRSVSLTKSGVLTTSYTREVDQPSHERDALDDKPRSHIYERPKSSTSPLHTLPVYEPRIEPFTSRRPELGYSRPALIQSQLNSTSYLEQPECNPRQAATSPRSTFSGSQKPFGEGAPAPATVSKAPRRREYIPDSGFSAARGRILQPNTTVNTLYPQLNEFYNEPVESDSDSEVEELAQRSIRPSFSPPATPQVRRRLGEGNQETPMTQFKELVNSVNRQYNLKLYFILILLTMFFTSVYVIMTSGER